MPKHPSAEEAFARSFAPRPPQPKPRRTTRVASQLTLLDQLRRSLADASLCVDDARDEHRPFLVGPFDRGPPDDAPRRRRCLPDARTARPPLTLRSRRTSEGRSLRQSPEEFPPPSRQGRWLVAPRKRLPSTDALSGALARALAENPSPCCPAHRGEPASDALSPLVIGTCLAAGVRCERLDSPLPEAHRLGALGAARRPSTSATNSTPQARPSNRTNPVVTRSSAR